MIGNGWRFSEPYEFERQREKRERIVKELLLLPRPEAKPLPDLTHLSKDEREKYIFEMQTPAMKAALLEQKKRKPEDDLEWVLRPMPACLANPDAKNKDELVAKRDVKIDEFTVLENYRRAQKNTAGTGETKSVDEEGRERAINAFTYSKPAEPSVADLKRLTKAKPLENAVQPVEAVKEEEKLGNYSLWRDAAWTATAIVGFLVICAILIYGASHYGN